MDKTCPESKCTAQDIKIPNSINTAKISRLSPKKKAKDTRNDKTMIIIDRNRTNLSEPFSRPLERTLNVELNSSSSGDHTKRSKGKSKDNIAMTDYIDSVNLTSAGKVDKIQHANEYKMENGHLKVLPSQMWWVPPLKEPSTYRPPSATMSAKSYSLISSICRPVRSADDLRKKVISECKRLEAKVSNGQEMVEDKEEDEKLKAEVEGMSLDEFATAPSQSLSNNSPTESAIKMVYPRKAAGRAHSLSGIFDLKTECGNDCFSRFETELDFKVSDSSFPTEDKIVSSMAVRSMGGSQPFFRSQGSQYENVDCRETVRYASIGELTRKHIINPMAAQLARLCMKQGQLYMNVLDDLEKSCEELESACPNQSLAKFE